MARTLSLEGLWDFCPDPDERGQADGWATRWPEGRRPCVLPLPWNLMDPALFKYEGIVWFFRTVPSLPEGEWWIAGDGVNHRVTAWANGVLLGSHEGGYLPFEFALPHRAMAPLRLALAVDNRLGPKTLPPAGADWFNWGGVVRRLCLRVRPAVHLADVNAGTTLSGALVVEGQVAGRDAETCRVEARLLDADGASVWEAQVSPRGGADGPGFSLSGTVARPRLWSPDQPAMYTLVVRVAGGGETEGDVQTLPIGFREVRAEGCRILLNGQPIRLRGISRHEAHPHVGNAGIDQLAFADLLLLKRAGANLVRLAHYPHDPHVLDLADRLGVLVFAELPTIWLGEEQMADPEVLARAVATFDALWQRDRHHPSIILWGLLAECATQTEAGERFFAALTAHVRQRDPGRLITQASETPDGDRCFQYADVLGLNYFHGWYADAPLAEYGEALDRLHANFPDKPILLSSHGADAIAGFRSFHHAKWSEEAQAAYHAAVIAEVRRRPFVAGQSIWLLADYQGPAWRTARFTPLQRPKEQNNKGLLDEYRRPKLAYDQVQALYRAWADE
jgi:beta-glucuronidase